MSAPVADRYLAGLAELDAYAAQALGEQPEVIVPLLSPEAFAARHELAVAASTVDPIDPLGAALAERTASDIALYEAGFTTRLLAPLATPVHQVRGVFDKLPTGTEDDWAVVAANLERVPAALADYADTLRLSADRGNVVPLRQIRAVAAQCASWVDRDDFYPALVRRHTGPLTSRLAVAASAAAAATADFAAFLTGELAPRAPEEDAVGRELYEVTASAFLGARVDLDDLYEYGWALLRELEEALAGEAAKITGRGVPAALSMLDRDPRRLLSGADALVGWLRDRVAETTDALDGTHFDIPARTRAVECDIVRADAGVMYYVPPDPGLTRPGRVWWTVPSGDVASWRQISALHHESLPGHHLQHAITMALPDLHPWQRALCHVHGYAEGWAHYAEQLADELGLIRDPGERIGLLLDRRWRAARIVIDLGLHLRLPIPRHNGVTAAESWNVAVAREVLTDVAGLAPHTAAFEVDRYLGWPGQALSFGVGARLWRETRAAAERAAGTSFDRKAFHAAALALGPMGLDPLRRFLTTEDHPPA
ncbi:DUF885 domain-containing protein [Amycolatopsis taiwanensis]|uniref:DUF885 domain-containing protein n=1 Tax=Amycolatopsis taiwanensis TaxID=342230 RepID=A0A9W6VF27_9PSEU|nr:DUF885 domain-containing protein [Amycolatopsis taiwanensis]GLY69113.1 hypothetical protein Atai01_57320 [Amycolatopsis taiwanensis]